MGKMSEIDAGYQSAMQFRELGNNESESELVENRESLTIPKSISSIKIATYYYVTDDGSLGLDIESMSTEFNEKMENVEQAFIEINNKNKFTHDDEGKLIRRNNAS
ncbi:hypothetical protein [uncultured Mediterranean phage uvMED]|nr:hypothetical protein [uncultured Mediterranean phage uvMED]